MRDRLSTFWLPVFLYLGTGIAWLASADITSAQTSTDLFLHGTGPDNNPPTLFLNITAPTASAAKFRDSASINFSGGNLWKDIGTWPAAPALTAGTVTALSDLHVWLGLKNRDDQGTQFDLRADVLKNGAVIASGLTRCITGIVRNANQAKEVTVAFGSMPPMAFNGTSDELSIKISTRIGTNPDDTKCSGHNNAAGLRLYFDATSRPARFDATITTVAAPAITGFSPGFGLAGDTVTITGTGFVSVQSVTFNGLPASTFTVPDATTISAVVPAGASTGPIAVTTPGGTATSAEPFTVPAPPVLAPIGNKTLPLGSTLSFTVTATDPNGDPVQFAVTPLPLPAHASFHTQTGVFTFTPDATQVGPLTLTFLASDDTLASSETITITVTGAPPGGTTSLTGRVDDTSQHPLDNLTVSLKGTSLSTTTAADGTFTLTSATMPTGRQQLVVTGLPQNFANLVAPVDLIPNVSNQLPQALTLPPIDQATAVTVNPAATTVLTSSTLNVTVTIPPNTAKNADGTPYTGQLTISPVPEYGRPESRPVELKPGLSVTIQPAGIIMDPPAPITFSNQDNMAPGNELDLWSLSPDTGTFYVAGRMKVSADGTKLETVSGGVRRTAWHFPLPPAAQIPNDQNRIIGGCTTCTMASGGDLTEGTLTQDVVIPGVRTVGVSRDLTLRYTSTTADVRPILPVTLTLDAIAAVPQTFSADITVGGLQQGNRGYWNASVMNESATSTTRLGVQYDASPLPTGRYPYELTTFSNYGLAGNSGIGAVSHGFTMIRNEQQSAFGAGWTLRSVDRLIPTAGDTLLVARGDGRTIPLVNTSVADFVSWWPAEGSAEDLRGGFNGALQNGVTFAPGQVGQGFNLDGSNDFVSVPHNAAHNPSILTIAAWVNIAQAPATGQEYYLVSKYGGNFDGYILRLGSALVPTFSLHRVPNADSQTTSATAIPLNTWVHLAATYDGTTATIYINGVAQGSSTFPGGYTGTSVPMAIGAASWFNGGYTKGVIDGVELYARAESAGQVNALFTAGGRKDVAADFSAPPGEYSILKRNPDSTYTRTLKDGTVYQFNAQGYQTAIRDRNGNQTAYAYDGSGRLTTITDPAGQVTTFGYTGGRLATITDPASRVTQFQHDTAGNLTRVTYTDMSQLAFAYDPQHRLTQRTDAQTHIYTYQFDYAGRLHRATLPGGAFREIRPTELTAVPNLAAGEGTATNPGPLTQPPVIQATFTDAKGQATIFETNSIGQVVKQTDPLNRVTLINRNAQGNPTRITRPNNTITTMTYDIAANLLTSTEEAIGATTTFTYEPAFNQVTSIKDPKNNLTTITYDASGNPLTITDADNKVTTFTYDSRGLVLTSTDALNQTTTFTYDALGRLLTTTDPLNRTTTLTYDAAGNVATSKDPLNRLTAFEYDAKNRLKKVTDPLNGITQYTYDGNGNLLTVTDAKNQTTTFAYDARNRLISTTNPLSKMESYTYDGNDNILTRVTPKNETIAFAYDAVNQLLNKTLPGSLVTSYTYDTVGNLTGVTDPDSVLAMTYDGANRLLTTSTTGSPNQPAVTLTTSYDLNGNRATLVDPVQETGFTYDGLNRLTALTGLSPQPSLAPPLSGLLAAYPADGTADDPINQQHGTLNDVTFAGSSLNQAFAFDGVDDFVSVPDSALLDTLTTGITVEAWIKPELLPGRATYDVFARRTEPSATTGFTVFLTDGGRLAVWVEATTGGLSQFATACCVIQFGQWQHLAVTADVAQNQVTAYLNGQALPLLLISGSGTLSGTLLPADHLFLGRRGAYQPDNNQSYKGLIDELRLYSRALTTAEVQSRLDSQALAGYSYDALSRRTSLTLPNGIQTTYTYDPGSQVTNILHQITAASTQINKADYVYNGVGNRTSLTDRRGTQTFDYDNLDRLTSATHPLPPTSQTFAYDAVGNRTSNGSLSNTGNQLTEDVSFTYEYDANGNQAKKTNKNTNNFTQYTYDAENRLVQVEDFAAGNPTPTATNTYRYDGLGRRIEKATPAGTKRYIYDGEDILLEYNGSNVLQARYTHGPGIDEPITVTKSGSTFFYHQDGLRSVTDLTDSMGATTKSYAYDAYGAIVEQTGTLEQLYSYTGREFDSESGFYYYRARYYDPAAGRFLQKDPLRTEMRKGRNLYPYVRNNPLRFTDPSGLQGVEDCKYYDDLCKKSQLPCMTLDSYACKAGDCCRDFGDGPITNQVRSCLINIDHICTKLPDSAQQNCRDLAHTFCYGTVSKRPESWPPPESCRNIGLFGGMLAPFFRRKNGIQGKKASFIILLLTALVGLLGIHEFRGIFVVRGGPKFDVFDPNFIMLILTYPLAFLYTPLIFLLLLWVRQFYTDATGFTENRMARITLLMGCILVGFAQGPALFIPDWLQGRWANIYHSSYTMGWCFILSSLVIFSLSKKLVLEGRLSWVALAIGGAWWSVSLLGLRIAPQSFVWPFLYIGSLTVALFGLLSLERHHRLIAFIGLLLISSYRFMGSPFWVNVGMLLDPRIREPNDFIAVTAWVVALGWGVGLFRKLGHPLADLQL